jgi:hypothetical protein
MTIGVGLVVPSAAAALVTIGSNLGRAPDAGQGCGVSRCTLVPGVLPASALASGGLVSPVNGTVVNWRVRTGSSTTPDEFRVIRLFADGSATALGTSPTVTPPLNTTQAYPVQLPIKIGDTIGINCCGNPSDDILVSTTPTAQRYIYGPPPLVDGASPQMQSSPPVTWELAINADIEPTSAFSIGKVKAKKGGKVTVRATLPNPGTVEAGDAGDKSLAASAAKKKGTYLKRASVAVTAAGQTVEIPVKPTKTARSLLAERGALKAKLKVVFTPTGGSASAQVAKVKLKR